MSDGFNECKKSTCFICGEYVELHPEQINISPFYCEDCDILLNNSLEVNKMDYKVEYEKIKAFEPKKYFKANAGRHAITFLSEAVETEFKDGNDVTPQVEFKIRIDDESYNWTVPVGQSFKSLYGQLMTVAKEWETLKDRSITLLVTGDNTTKSYVVLEALTYLQEKAPVSNALKGV